eukprot:125005-Rhodomonas_salina.1
MALAAAPDFARSLEVPPPGPDSRSRRQLLVSASRHIHLPSRLRPRPNARSASVLGPGTPDRFASCSPLGPPALSRPDLDPRPPPARPCPRP